MVEWVDFREVRDAVSLETVLFTYYEIPSLTRRGAKVTGPCPVHGGNSPRAFHADLEKNVWHCFSQCRAGGNQLDFVAKRENISIREAALRLKRAFMDRDTGPPRSPADVSGPERPHASPPRRGSGAANVDVETPTTPVEPNPPLTVELALKAEHPHLVKDRGLSLATIETFGVGYCSRGILRGTIAIPIENAEGVRVAYAGRRLKPSEVELKGKYVFPRGFRKELELYNFARAKAHLETDGLILVEGFFTVMKLHQAGIDNAVASMGCHLSPPQAALCRKASQVLILYDGNDAGRLGAASAREALTDHTVVRVAELPEGLEPDDLEPRALRWLVRGMRELDIKTLSFALRPRST